VPSDFHCLNLDQAPALVTFVSADSELNAAAASEDLLVENPNNYPECLIPLNRSCAA
jgi:hypothetical protein